MPTSKRTKRLIKHFMGTDLLDKQNLSIRPIQQFKAPNTGAQDFATYLLTHTSGDKKTAKMFGNSIASRTSAESEKASVLSSIFDALSTPLYASSHFFQGMAEMDPNKNILQNLGHEFKSAGEAIVGMEARQGANALGLLPGDATPFDLKNKLSDYANRVSPKITGQNILHENFGVKNKVARYGGGFALDVLMDPTTYIGGGIGKAKGVKDVLDAKAARTAPEGGLSQAFKHARAQQGGLARPKVNLGFNVAEQAVGKRMVRNPLHENPVPKMKIGGPAKPQPLMDAIKFQPRTRELERLWGKQEVKMAKDVESGRIAIPDPARTATQKLERADKDFQRAMLRSGKVAEPSGRFSTQSANQIVNDILTGKSPRYSIQAPKATGEASQRARDIADDMIDNLMGPKRASKEHPQRTGSFLKRGPVKEVTPGQQVALYNRILRDGNVSEGGFDAARQMLASAEDHMIALGVQPVWHNGMRVRLSDVIEATHDKGIPFPQILKEFTKSDMSKMDPVIRSTIHGLAAQRSLTMSEITSNLTKLADKARSELLNYSPIERPAKEAEIVKTSIEAAMQRGMTNKEIASVKDLVKDVVNIDKLPTDKWVETSYHELKKAAIEGRVDRKLVTKFEKAIADNLGVSQKTLSTDITGRHAVDQVMTHMTTWWGKGDWQQISKDVFDVGEENAVARAKMMRNITLKYKPEEINEAWKHATGLIETSDPASLELGTFFKNYMRTVLKVQDHGLALNNELTKELSVAEKSMTQMEDVNRTLKQMNGVKAFQFTNSAKARNFGRVRDYSKGTDWMTSWDRWGEVADPVSFMYDIDLAMERVTKEYAFLDSFVGAFGSVKQTATHNYYMNLSRIKGFWVPEEHGKQIMRVMNDLYKGGFHPNSQTGKFYAKALRIWKTGVTIYLPSHHIRNAIGDINLMWLAGHNDPRAFIYARRIMASQRTKYKKVIKHGDFDALEQLTSPEAMKWAATQGKDVILNVKGKRVTADQLYVGAYQHGLLRDAYAFEDIYAEGAGQIGAASERGSLKNIVTRPLGGKMHDAMTTAAEYREHYIRLAHFTSAVNKNLKKGKNLKTAMDDAAHEVRKWHPDGRDLTYTEQKIRMVIPFYSWLRKSTPLLVQSMVTAPAKQLAIPRANLALQGMMGQEGMTMSDPYPDDQLFPEWIRSYGMGPIGDPESDNIMSRWWGNLGRNMIDEQGNKYGYTIVNPSDPLIDFGGQMLGFGPRDTLQGIRDSLTPAIKVPYEVASGTDFTGGPIYKDDGGQGLLHYLAKQVPLLSPIQRVTDTGDRQREGVENGPIDQEALINIMTALGIRGTGPYIKSAEFEARDKRKK